LISSSTFITVSTSISVISGFSFSISISEKPKITEITIEKGKPGISEIVIKTKVEKPEETELTIESDKIEISELIPEEEKPEILLS
jgi:hypothetical protein